MPWTPIQHVRRRLYSLVSNFLDDSVRDSSPTARSLSFSKSLSSFFRPQVLSEFSLDTRPEPPMCTIMIQSRRLMLFKVLTEWGMRLFFVSTRERNWEVCPLAPPGKSSSFSASSDPVLDCPSSGGNFGRLTRLLRQNCV